MHYELLELPLNLPRFCMFKNSFVLRPHITEFSFNLSSVLNKEFWSYLEKTYKFSFVRTFFILKCVSFLIKLGPNFTFKYFKANRTRALLKYCFQYLVVYIRVVASKYLALSFTHKTVRNRLMGVVMRPVIDLVLTSRVPNILCMTRQTLQTLIW